MHGATGSIIFRENRMRSWCLVGPDGKPVDGWKEILPEDLHRITK